jgi:hypothetical protein
VVRELKVEPSTEEKQSRASPYLGIRPSSVIRCIGYSIPMCIEGEHA